MVLTEDRLLPKTENERKWVCSNFQKGITSAKARTLFGGVLGVLTIITLILGLAGRRVYSGKFHSIIYVPLTCTVATQPFGRSTCHQFLLSYMPIKVISTMVSNTQPPASLYPTDTLKPTSLYG